jgi:hypothetical protein
MAQSPYLDQNAPEILALERQKKLADLLQSRALEQPQGQMVSGRYVAPSIIQQLAPLANAYMGRKAGEDVESRQSKLANLIRGQNVTETKDILETMYGKQGQAVPMTAPSTDADAQPSGFYGDKPSIEMQGGVAPDKMGALLKSLNAQSTGGQSLAPTILAQLNAKPVFHSVAPGASLVQETPTGVKPVFTVPKENVVTGNLAEAADFLGFGKDPSKWTSNQRKEIDDYMERDANRKRMKIDLSGVVNPQGGYNKKGDWVTPNGAAINHTEVAKDREIVRSANDLREGLAEITPVDIKKQASLLGDVTQGGAKGYIAKQLGLDALKAQVKINASAVQQTLQNLPPGPASDKDISQAKSTFPGYGDADALKDWIDNTNRMLERKIRNTNEKYGNPNWYGATTVEANPRSAPTTSDGFSIREKK